MSMKARSAIGLAGHGGDFVTWFGDRGGWETSNAFTTDAGAMVLRQFLEGQSARPRLREGVGAHAAGERVSTADDVPGEGSAPAGRGRFPTRSGGRRETATRRSWRTGCSRRSPTNISSGWRRRRSTRWISAPANRTDFLGVSFSMLDAVGHAFGPRSHEVQDVLVRLDETIGRLLDHLDEKVGAGQVRRRLQRRPRRRGIAGADRRRRPPVDGRGRAASDREVAQAARRTRAVHRRDQRRRDLLEARRLRSAARRIRSGAEGHSKPLRALPGVERVFRSDEVSRRRRATSRDPVLRAVALSYYPGAAATSSWCRRRNWLLSTSGTTHGSPHPYDQRVPVSCSAARSSRAR